MNYLGLLITVVSLVTMGCLNLGNSDNDGDGGNPESTVIYSSFQEIINFSNEFAFEMYLELLNGSENVFFSPYSITTALGMAYEGAKGDTAREMESVLDLPWNSTERLVMMNKFQEKLNEVGAGYALSTANSYWLSERGELEPNYIDAIEQYYLAQGDRLDFAGDPSGAVETINSWVENETQDKIKDLLSEEDIDMNTYLILTNAVYFKSDWLYQFDKEATQEDDFHLSEGGTVTAEFMHMCDETKALKHGDNADFQMLQLPYKDRDTNMYVLLSKGTAGDITSLEGGLDQHMFSSLKDTMTPQYVDVYLPKFKLEEKYNLKDQLMDMGMPKAFTPSADFSNMTPEPVYIDKVIHQSFVEVDEEGTEAAAATAVIMRNYSAGPSATPIEFRADLPFVFIIEHQETGQILFMGKVEDPRS